MSVVIAIPTYSGEVRSECMLSTLAATHLLQGLCIPYEVFFVMGCPYVHLARNALVAMFMATEMDDLFFIDSDVGFDPVAFIKILDRPEKLVAGVYPLKRDGTGWPVEIKTIDGIPIGRDGLIEATRLPTGFMRIKRTVIEWMQAAYPDLKYTNLYTDQLGKGPAEAYDLFGMTISKAGTIATEDYAFCQRWTDMGGQVWVYPDIDFTHVGAKRYQGNFHQFLLRQPGGAECEERKEESLHGEDVKRDTPGVSSPG